MPPDQRTASSDNRSPSSLKGLADISEADFAQRLRLSDTTTPSERSSTSASRACSVSGSELSSTTASEYYSAFEDAAAIQNRSHGSNASRPGAAMATLQGKHATQPDRPGNSQLSRRALLHSGGREPTPSPSSGATASSGGSGSAHRRPARTGPGLDIGRVAAEHELRNLREIAHQERKTCRANIKNRGQLRKRLSFQAYRELVEIGQAVERAGLKPIEDRIVELERLLELPHGNRVT